MNDRVLASAGLGMSEGSRVSCEHPPPAINKQNQAVEQVVLAMNVGNWDRARRPLAQFGCLIATATSEERWATMS